MHRTVSTLPRLPITPPCWEGHICLSYGSVFRVACRPQLPTSRRSTTNVLPGCMVPESSMTPKIVTLTERSSLHRSRIIGSAFDGCPHKRAGTPSQRTMMVLNFFTFLNLMVAFCILLQPMDHQDARFCVDQTKTDLPSSRVCGRTRRSCLL